jgi:hypothetical protein
MEGEEKIIWIHFQALQVQLRKILQNETKQKRHSAKDKAIVGGLAGIAE